MFDGYLHFKFLPIVWSLSLVACLSFGAEVRLFDEEGRAVENYSQILVNLVQGDVLKFQDGNEFIVVSHLGSGELTQVMLVTQKQRGRDEPKQIALRLPRNSGFNSVGISYEGAITTYIDNEAALRRAGVSTPKIYRSIPGQYAAVEKIDVTFSFEDFLSELTLKPRPKAREALKAFARSLALIGELGDFHLKQLVYEESKNRWVLLDWLNVRPISLLNYLLSSHPFKTLFHERWPDTSNWTKDQRALFFELFHEVEEERRLHYEKGVVGPIVLFVARCLRGGE